MMSSVTGYCYYQQELGLHITSADAVTLVINCKAADFSGTVQPPRAAGFLMGKEKRNLRNCLSVGMFHFKPNSDCFVDA
jgi:hypothetical protein